MAKKKKAPATPQQAATSQVEQALAPILADIQSRAAKTSSNLGGVYEALAQAQGNVAPAIQETYAQAGAQTDMFARGFADTLQKITGQGADEANAILQQQGSPQTVDSGAGAGAVLYGLGGLIPGQALAREGAGFTSAAQMLPGQARTLGAQAQQQTFGDMEEQIRKIEAERPGLIQKALSEIEASRLGRDEFDLKRTIAERQGWVDEQQVEQGWTELDYRTQQAAASAQEAAAEGAKPNASLSKVYGYVVDSNGVPILGPNGKKIPVKKSGKKDVSPESKSVIISRATSDGGDALEKLIDRIGAKIDADPKFADEAKADAELERRLTLNFGAAMAAVIRAIGPHLKLIGYTPAQVRAEARKIVEREIAPPPKRQKRSGR